MIAELDTAGVDLSLSERLKHVVGFSGGIDSQACARWVLNRFPAEDVILLNSDVGGHEHWMTTRFIQEYSEKVHPVTQVSPAVVDMGAKGKAKIAELGLKPDDPLTFPLMAKIKGIFPSRVKQFCTQHLKLEPAHRWMKANLRAAGLEWVRYAGVRRDESDKRSDRKPVEWDDFFGCPLYLPIVDWTKQMCFDFCIAHGESVNPLYSLGFSRVGCSPCVNAKKADILAWCQRDPGVIDKVRGYEVETGLTFFPPIVPGKRINWIDDVVRWSKTTRGGKQFSLTVLEERPSCESPYGLCE